MLIKTPGLGQIPIKKILTLIILLLAITQFTRGAENKEHRIVSGGFGVGIGIFYPTQINDYIKDQTSHLLITSGVADMIINYIGKVSISVRPHQIIEISGFLEFGWAPKLIIVDMDETYYYAFTKMSPGLSPKIHIPFGTGSHSIFIAPAVTYNFLKFKDGQYDDYPPIKDKCWGGKLQFGFNLEYNKIILKPYLGYDYTKAVNGYMELNYSGAQIGIDFHF